MDRLFFILFFVFVLFTSESKTISSSVKKESVLTVGRRYEVNLTHVNSPVNFFVQLSSPSANLINSAGKWYKNDLVDKNE